MVINKKATRTHRQQKTPKHALTRELLFFFVTKTSRHSVGPKSLCWVSPFPLICWCSFLERRPVCVTMARASPVQGRAEALPAPWRRGPADAAETHDPDWPQLIWKTFWKCVFLYLQYQVGSNLQTSPGNDSRGSFCHFLQHQQMQLQTS